MTDIKREVFDITDVKMASDVSRVYRSANDGSSSMVHYEEAIPNKSKFRFFGVNNMRDELIGFAFYQLVGEVPQLLQIAVDDDYKGKRVGKFLVSESLTALAMDNRAERVKVSVVMSLARTRFYGSCGFTDTDGNVLGDEHVNAGKYRILLKDINCGNKGK